MTLEEGLDMVLINAIKAGTGECWRCNGAGVVDDYDGEPERVTLPDGRTAVVAPMVECDTCNGDKVLVATLGNDPQVAATVFGTAIVVAAMELEKGNFDHCHRAVEWGRKLWFKFVSEYKGSIEDALKDYKYSIVNSPLNDLIKKTEVVANGSALSKDELKELMKE